MYNFNTKAKDINEDVVITAFRSVMNNAEEAANVQKGLFGSGSVGKYGVLVTKEGEEFAVQIVNNKLKTVATGWCDKWDM